MHFQTSYITTKNTIMKPIAYCIYTFFLIMAFISCSKEDKITLNNENLKGVWFEENYLEEYNRISRLEYIFKKKSNKKRT